MLKKSSVLLVLILICASFLAGIALAADQPAAAPAAAALTEEEKKIDKAYSCLAGKVAGKSSSLGFSDKVFTLLAMAYNASLQREYRDAIISLSQTSANTTCWPKDKCTLKETALAILALKNTGKDVSAAENYLLSNSMRPAELRWFLEIDTAEVSSCIIGYEDKSYTVEINAEGIVTGNAGPGLVLAENNLWLAIQPSAMNVSFSISCDKSFTTAIIYKKQGSDTLFVSSLSNSASAGGITNEQIVSLCFKQGTACNYEGSLWAVMALAKSNADLSSYLPYLIAYADQNPRLLPDAFLYSLTDFNEYLLNLANLQNIRGYWKAGINQYYDTALAMLVLRGTDQEPKVDSAKTYLLDVMPANGCWQNSIQDTAFILYAGWPKDAATLTGETPKQDCNRTGYYCTNLGQCSRDANGGEILSAYSCTSASKVCCSKAAVEKSCADIPGKICSSTEECSVGTVSSKEGDCCPGDCEKLETCSEKGGKICARDQLCSITEVRASDTNSCCTRECKGGEAGKMSIWIWILIILIILTALGIIFRKKLRLFIFKIQSKFRKEKPGAPAAPAQPAPTLIRRPIAPPRLMPSAQPVMRARPQPSAASKTDKELEETLRKLKEMRK